MLFHTLPFAVFLAAVLALYFTLPARWLIWMLVVASYLFYGWVEPRYALLMLASSIVDFSTAIYFSKQGDPRRRRQGIWISAIFNFGILGYFKYTNFAMENLQAALDSIGISYSPQFIHVMLPLGISFYTFHTFSYCIDVLTGKFPPCRSLSEFLLFVSYFPQLVAGPIARGEQMLPELRKIRSFRFGMVERIPEAVILFAEGFIRKASADWLALTANDFFALKDLSTASTGAVVLGIVSFSLQIYGDFCGYTRMAQGVSWLFGVKLAENFNLPYVSQGPQEFWRRWHISLSTWFRDYLYIPLGGNHGSAARVTFNLVLTMLVSGLWHGASWTFVLWGAIHAAYLVIEKIFRAPWKAVPTGVRVAVMWVLVFLAWVPFRAPSVKWTLECYRALGHGGWVPIPPNIVAGALGLILCDLAYALRKRTSNQGTFPLETVLARWSEPQWAASAWVSLCFGVWLVNEILWKSHAATFIYFQF